MQIEREREIETEGKRQETEKVRREREEYAVKLENV